MGLDITAYSNIKRLDAHLKDDGEAVYNSNGEAEEIGSLFFEQYKHWQSAMEMASNNGCISFH